MHPGLQMILIHAGVVTMIFIILSAQNYPAPHEKLRICGDRPLRPVRHRSTRMIGGVNVGVDVWPWQVSILYQPNSSAPFRQICGGAVVHEKWVMTAAACALEDKGKLLVRAGSNSLDVDDASTQISEISRSVVHKNFGPYSVRYNIALLEMKTPFVFNSYVAPICVPNENLANYNFESCYITGYNAQPGDDVGMLQEAKVWLISRSLCNKALYWNYTVSPDFICAGEFDGGINGCEANLGGPLSCYIKMFHSYFLIGFRVKATSCELPHQPNIYIKVHTYFYWIEKVMNVTLI